MSRTGGEGIRLTIKVDAERASADLRAARREIGPKVKAGLKEAGERIALPAAKHATAGLKVGGHSVPTTLTVRATQRDAYVTTTLRGKLNRAVGLQEFGGTVRTIIRPKKAGALSIAGSDHPVSIIRTPRHYKANLNMSRAIQLHKAQIAEAVTDNVMEAFD